MDEDEEVLEELWSGGHGLAGSVGTRTSNVGTRMLEEGVATLPSRWDRPPPPPLSLCHTILWEWLHPVLAGSQREKILPGMVAQGVCGKGRGCERSG